MKLRVTLEIEVSDLPDDEREEIGHMEDAIGGDELDDDEGVPLLADQDPEEVKMAITEALHDLGSSYISQREMWAGTGFYGYMSSVSVLRCDEVPDHPVFKLLSDAASQKLTISVFDDPANPDYVGRSPDEAWEHVTACDEIKLVNSHGDRVGWAAIVHDGDPAEAIADYSGPWMRHWDDAQKKGDDNPFDPESPEGRAVTEGRMNADGTLKEGSTDA
jgi:hypothetical protein